MDLWMDVMDDGVVSGGWAKVGEVVSGSKFDGLYLVS